MTHTTVGGTGTVDQVGWAKLMAALGVRFRVADPTSWAPSVVAGVDRTVRLAVGSAEACGVLDTTDITYDLQCTANGTTSDRYDLIVATWTWSVSGCSAAFSIIQGTAGAGIPSAGVLTRNPGATYQAVVAVAKVRPSVGTFSAGDLTDPRVWGGDSGPLVTNAPSTFWHLIDLPPGGRLNNAGITWRLEGSTWKVAEPVDLTSIAARTSAFPAPYQGLTCTVAGALHTYDGGAWRHAKRGYGTQSTDAGGNIVTTHGLGAAPTGVLITPGPQATDLLNRVVDMNYTGLDASNFVIYAKRSDTNAALGSNLLTFAWEAFV